MRTFRINDSLSCEYVYQKHGSPGNPDEHHLLIVYGDDKGIGYCNERFMVLHNSAIEKWHKMFFEHALTFKQLFEKSCKEVN